MTATGVSAGPLRCPKPAGQPSGRIAWRLNPERLRVVENGLAAFEQRSR
jgi:hypothetical protein